MGYSPHLNMCLQVLGSSLHKLSAKQVKNNLPHFFVFFILFALLLYLPVNSYGHGGTFSSHNHTFSWANLNKRLTSNLCTYFSL